VQDLDRWLGRGETIDDRSRAVGRGVIDDEDVRLSFRNLGQSSSGAVDRLLDVGRLVEGRDDDPDAPRHGGLP
jgi:hypothetical protein